MLCCYIEMLTSITVYLFINLTSRIRLRDGENLTTSLLNME